MCLRLSTTALIMALLRVQICFSNCALSMQTSLVLRNSAAKNDLRYAAENITSRDDNVTLMIGVDTAVYHGFVNCGATGAITGIGNAIPKEVLLLCALCQRAADGHAEARVRALELEEALGILSSFDEGADLVLYYKHLMVLNGDEEYRLHFNETDELSDSQRNYVEAQYSLFRKWFANWSAQGGDYRRMRVIDSHTAGEPTRVIVDGGPDLGTRSLVERAARLEAEHRDFCDAVLA